jgi:hypothetical protein
VIAYVATPPLRTSQMLAALSSSRRIFEVAERAHPGVGEEAAPGYSAARRCGLS